METSSRLPAFLKAKLRNVFYSWAQTSEQSESDKPAYFAPQFWLSDNMRMHCFFCIWIIIIKVICNIGYNALFKNSYFKIRSTFYDFPFTTFQSILSIFKVQTLFLFFIYSYHVFVHRLCILHPSVNLLSSKCV